MTSHFNASLDKQSLISTKFGELRLLRITMLVVFIAVPSANFLLAPILSDGSQFADDPDVRVAAAGYAFAIWGVIFTGMLAFSGYLVFGDEPDSRDLRVALGGMISAGLASIAFVPISIYLSQTAGWIDIVFHLIALVVAMIFLRRHVRTNPRNTLGRWLFSGLSLYLGWISAATVISTALLASEWGVNLPEATATGLATAAVLLLSAIGIWMTMKNDPFYGSTVCWALIAVGVEQQEYQVIQYASWGGAVILAMLIGFHFVNNRPVFYSLE